MAPRRSVPSVAAGWGRKGAVSAYQPAADPTAVVGKRVVAFIIDYIILQAIWSILFFRFQSPLYALVDIVALWVAIILTALSFAKISKPAAWMLVPYLCWVTFATFLNYVIYRLNR